MGLKGPSVVIKFIAIILLAASVHSQETWRSDNRPSVDTVGGSSSSVSFPEGGNARTQPGNEPTSEVGVGEDEYYYDDEEAPESSNGNDQQQPKDTHQDYTTSDYLDEYPAEGDPAQGTPPSPDKDFKALGADIAISHENSPEAAPREPHEVKDTAEPISNPPTNSEIADTSSKNPSNSLEPTDPPPVSLNSDDLSLSAIMGDEVTESPSSPAPSPDHEDVLYYDDYEDSNTSNVDNERPLPVDQGVNGDGASDMSDHRIMSETGITVPVMVEKQPDVVNPNVDSLQPANEGGEVSYVGGEVEHSYSRDHDEDIGKDSDSVVGVQEPTFPVENHEERFPTTTSPTTTPISTSPITVTTTTTTAAPTTTTQTTTSEPTSTQTHVEDLQIEPLPHESSDNPGPESSPNAKTVIETEVLPRDEKVLDEAEMTENETVPPAHHGEPEKEQDSISEVQVGRSAAQVPSGLLTLVEESSDGAHGNTHTQEEHLVKAISEPVVDEHVDPGHAEEALVVKDDVAVTPADEDHVEAPRIEKDNLKSSEIGTDHGTDPHVEAPSVGTDHTEAPKVEKDHMDVPVPVVEKDRQEMNPTEKGHQETSLTEKGHQEAPPTEKEHQEVPSTTKDHQEVPSPAKDHQEHSLLEKDHVEAPAPETVNVATEAPSSAAEVVPPSNEATESESKTEDVLPSTTLVYTEVVVDNRHMIKTTRKPPTEETTSAESSVHIMPTVATTTIKEKPEAVSNGEQVYQPFESKVQTDPAEDAETTTQVVRETSKSPVVSTQKVIPTVIRASAEEPPTLTTVLVPLKSGMTRGRNLARLFDQIFEKQQQESRAKTSTTSTTTESSPPSVVEETGSRVENNVTSDNNDRNNTDSSAVPSTTEASFPLNRRFPSLSRKPFLAARPTPRSRPSLKIAIRKTSDILKAPNAGRPPIPRRISPERPQSEAYPSDPDRDKGDGSSPTTTTTTQRAITTLSPYFLWGRSVEVDCTLKLIDGVNWTRELEDHDSSDFKSLANSVQRELNALYRGSEFGSRFKGIQIEGFSRGSVFVDYTLYLTESDEPLIETELWTSFIDALENYTIMGPYMLDPDYLSFTVVRKILPPSSENEDDGFLLPHWAIAVIVIGAASLLFVLIICIVMTKNRRGGKRKYGTPLKEDSVADRGKNWDRSTYDNLGAESIYNINGTWDSKKLKQHARNYNLYGMAASITPASDTSLYGVTAHDSRTGSGSTKGETSSGGGGRYYDSWRSDWSNRIPKQSDYDTTF